MRDYCYSKLPVWTLLIWWSLVCISGTRGQSVVLKKHDGPVKAVAFSRDEKTLASGGEDHIIYFWNVENGEITGTIQNSFTVKSIAFTDDGYLLSACGNDIRLTDLKGQLIRTFSGYTTDVWSFSYSPQKKLITAGSYSRNIRVWDYLTAKPVFSLEGHEKSCLPVCFSPDGNVIASGSLDKTVRLWNAADGKQISKLDIHSENVFAVTFHPSGNYFVSASADKTIRLWRTDSTKLIRTFVGHKAAVFDVQFSPDGLHMLSCDAANTIILWETATGKKIATFSDHTAAVNAIRFNNNGTAFASASDDHTVRYQPLEKKFFLSGTWYEKQIEKEVAGSSLFAPRSENESKQDFAARTARANQFLEDLYEKYHKDYFIMLSKIPVE